jgi:hypothetical protein
MTRAGPDLFLFLSTVQLLLDSAYSAPEGRVSRPLARHISQAQPPAGAGPTAASGTLKGHCSVTMVHCNYCACDVDVEVDDANGFS